MSGAVEILLIEDSPYDAELTTRELEANNLAGHLAWVKDGAAALELLASLGARLPKLVVLDLNIPKMDGLSVLSAIRGDPSLRRIPVVILSSSREESVIAKVYALGANSYVIKPVQFTDFIRTVASLGLYWLHTNQTAFVVEPG